MDFSIIIPSFNQEKFIGSTMENVTQLKKLAAKKNISVEILLIDSESNTAVQEQISKYRSDLDYVDTRKDKGQYDAINKGLEVCKGTYWTWLNTDDHIDLDGFFKLAEMLKSDSTIDYIYGGVSYIDEKGNQLHLWRNPLHGHE